MSQRFAAVCLAIIAIGGCSRPPPEASIIDTFNAHKSTHERLHEMLLADKDLLLVASWGIETRNKRFPHKVATQDGLSSTRYDEYLRLLGEAGGNVAWKSESNGDTSVSVWSTGWAGDTRHVEVSWKEQPPGNLVSDLDVYHDDRGKRRKDGVYRHITGNWYLWADW